MMQKLLATSLGRIGEGEGFGPFNYQAVAVNTGPFTAIIKIVSTVIGFMTIAAGIFFMIQFLLSGFGWMTASGDKARLVKAQDRMIQSIMGLVIIVAAYSIVAVLSTVLGLDLLLTKPDVLIRQLQLTGGVPLASP